MWGKMVNSMVFNATFNNISAISWLLVLLVEETEKTTDLSQVTDKLYHIVLFISSWSRFELTTSVVIITDCIGSCKSKYYTITTTTVLVGDKDGGSCCSVHCRGRTRKCIDPPPPMDINVTILWLKHCCNERLCSKLLDYYGLNVYNLMQIYQIQILAK